MRRKDLETGIHLAYGIYLAQGEEADPEARIVQGPFPNTAEGKRTAEILGAQLAKRTGGAYCLVAVIELPS
jgi:hypothetical protein